MEIFIYGLYSNFDEEIRYVGKTNNVKRRLVEHIREAKLKKYKHLPKNRWILKVLRNGGQVLIKILDVATKDNWIEREKYWINAYRLSSIKENLNIRDGGEGFDVHDFLSYAECKKWREENHPEIKSQSEWKHKSRMELFPPYVPHNPAAYYKNFSWNDFFNKKEKPRLLSVFSVSDIKKTIRRKKLYTTNDVINYYIKDYKVPSVDYLCKHGFDLKKYLQETWYVPYEVLKRYLLLYFPNVSSTSSFKLEHKKMHRRIPYYVKDTYGCEFDDFHFLSFRKNGPDTYHTVRNFYTYEECRNIVHKLGFCSSNDFRRKAINNKICDSRIPHTPEIVYEKKGWQGWENFLGITSNKRRKNCNLSLFVRYMKICHKDIKTSTQYKKMYVTRNVSRRLPKRPDVKYKLRWEQLFTLIKGE